MKWNKFHEQKWETEIVIDRKMLPKVFESDIVNECTKTILRKWMNMLLNIWKLLDNSIDTAKRSISFRKL
jgi:hypothetical protein